MRLLAFALAAALVASIPAPADACTAGELPELTVTQLAAVVQNDILRTLDDTGGTWTQLGPMPIDNSEFSVALIDGLFYAVGGFQGRNQDKLLIYNPRDDSWTSAAPVPNPTHHSGVVAFEGKIYSIGGSRTEDLVQIYDPSTDSWSTGREMPTPRAAPAAVVHDGLIHVIGGTDSINVGVAKSAHEVYDPRTDTWEARAEVPGASEHVFAQSLGNRIYFAGGRDSFSNSSGVLAYNPNNDSWSRVASLLTATSGYAPAALQGKMYVLGGEDLIGRIVTARSQVYDPARNEWQALEPIPIPLHGIAGGSFGSSIYVFGGAEIAGSGVGSNVVFRFDPPGVEQGDVPKKPKRLKAKVRSATEVRLKWKDKSNDETGFEVQMSTAGGPFLEIQTTRPNTKKIFLDGLAPGTTYTFRARAVNDFGPSDFSNEKTVTTPDT